jgi:gamma-glutamyltranspeptidase/glutathione hydrolase
VTRALASLLVLCVAGPVWARQPVRARSGMVVTEEPIAADVGAAVVKSGGNAVDAAVAVALALAVTYPVAGNIGGGGFLLARFADGRTTFIDFRERAPAKASRDMYLDAEGKLTRDSIEGWRASGVPGTVRGLELAHKKYGSKPWKDLVAPAVQLARNGFPVSYGFAQTLRDGRERFSRYPSSAAAFGKEYEVGDTFVQPDLARTLDRIARDPNDFYEGETARMLSTAMAANGGLITLEDLKAYKAVERQPLTGRYKDYEVITAPPPSSGGVGILQMMGVLEGSGYEKGGWGSAATIHYLAEVMRRYYADRSEYLGDPDFTKVPVRALLNPQYIRKLRDSIDPDHASNSETIRPGSLKAYESSETTHFSIVDKAGNAVSLTYTLNGGHGSGVTAPGLGFLLNNEMDDFAAQPGSPNMFGLIQGEANAIQPAKRPLSSMTPTILTSGGKLFMVVGGPGGGRIISSVLQTILNVIDFGMNAQDAVDAPRFHHQWQPDKITMEHGFSPDTVHLLQQRGHTVEIIPAVARVFAIVVKDGWLQGAADGRSYGKAEGIQ